MPIELGAIVLVQWDPSSREDFDLSPAGPTAEALLIHNGRPHWMLRPTTDGSAERVQRLVPASPETLSEGCLVLLAIHFVEDDSTLRLLEDLRADPTFLALDGVDAAQVEPIHRAAQEACAGLMLTVYAPDDNDVIARGLAVACPDASVEALRATPVA